MRHIKRQRDTIEEINAKKPAKSRLIALEFTVSYVTRSGHSCRQIICLCTCGNKKTVTVSKFLRGHVSSCGCLLSREECSKRSTKYFPSIKELRRAYYDMLNRCYNKKHPSYNSYGGRGVVVCDEWYNDYQKFLDWAIYNGWKHGLQLDKDIKGDGLLYSPDTCSWVTRSANQNNKRNNPKYQYKGEMLTISQICKREGMAHNTLRHRIYNMKMSAEEAVATPLMGSGGRKKKIINISECY